MYDPFGKSVNNDEFKETVTGGPQSESKAEPSQPAEQSSSFISQPVEQQTSTVSEPAQEPSPVASEPVEEQPSVTYHYSYTIPKRTVEEPWTTGEWSAPENTAVQPRPVKTRTKKEKKSGLTIGKVIALLLCCALIGGAAGMGGAALMNGSRTALPAPASGNSEAVIYQGDRENTVISISEVDTSRLMTAAEVYATNVNSTVGITTSITTNYFGYQSTAAAAGSGFIITSDGYIVTNYHVIEKSNSIKVTMYDGTAFDATVVGYDESNDLAVLKVDATGLTPVILGDSDNLNVGDSVLAIGNPLGELTFSLTAGAVSAMNREVTLSNNLTMNLIQTDCAINSGNSGGALFNMYGEVIGITNAKYSGSGNSTEASIDNIGFAIPINSVRSIIDQIIEKGYLTKPFIGVTISTVTEEIQGYGLPAGASVQSVTEGAPADQAGLQVNDIITSVNGQEITSSQDLVNVVGACEPGDKLELTVYRSGETITVTVIVGETVKSALNNNSQNQQEQQEQQQQQQEQQQQEQQQQGQQEDNGFSFPFPFGFGNGNSFGYGNGGNDGSVQQPGVNG